MPLIVSKSAKEPAKTAKPNDANTSAVTQGVADLAVVDAPKVKSKNLDVIHEYKHSEAKNAANFVVIGVYSYFPHLGMLA